MGKYVWRIYSGRRATKYKRMSEDKAARLVERLNKEDPNGKYTCKLQLEA